MYSLDMGMPSINMDYLIRKYEFIHEILRLPNIKPTDATTFQFEDNRLVPVDRHISLRLTDQCEPGMFSTTTAKHYVWARIRITFTKRKCIII